MNKKTKIIIIIIASFVVVGGSVGTVLGVNAYNEKREREETIAFLESIDKARKDSVKVYNDRINQIVATLGDINTNNDIDKIANAINELNNVINDINNDTLLMQEQKNLVNDSVVAQVNSLNARIATVNEEMARKEAQEKAEAERMAPEMRRAIAGF